MSNQRRTTRRLSSRRDFLRGGGLALGAVALGPTVLAACGSDSKTSGSGSSSGGGSKSLYFANWPAYIDAATVDAFKKDTGIDLKYTEEYNDNNEYFAKIQPLLSEGKRIEPDIIAPTFWMAARLVNLGWLEKLPKDKIPNISNLREDLAKPTWDSDQAYNLPWQSGFAGIAYNKKVTGKALGAVTDLWDPAFKGKIGVLTEWRDTLGLIAMSLGIDITQPTASSLQPAIDLLKEKVDAGQIRQFTGNDYMDDLGSGAFAACVGWSGDVSQLSKDNPDVGFAIPESGGTLWFDTMVVPKGAANAAAAAQFMNYVYDVKNAARITAEIAYYSPVKGVKEELESMGGAAAEVAKNPLVFPDESKAKLLKRFGAMSEADEAKVDEQFAKLAGN